jgi:hypothetical protein
VCKLHEESCKLNHDCDVILMTSPNGKGYIRFVSGW